MNVCMTGLARTKYVLSILREITPGVGAVLGEATGSRADWVALTFAFASGTTTAITTIGAEEESRSKVAENCTGKLAPVFDLANNRQRYSPSLKVSAKIVLRNTPDESVLLSVEAKSAEKSRATNSRGE